MKAKVSRVVDLLTDPEVLGWLAGYAVFVACVLTTQLCCDLRCLVRGHRWELSVYGRYCRQCDRME